MNLTKEQISTVAVSIGLDYPTFMAFIMTETGGDGFNPPTGKVIIRFEIQWFARFLAKRGIPYNQNGLTLTAKGVTFTVTHTNQAAEWENFDSAWKIDQKSAMLSTSYGLMQIMGFNFTTAGFDTVDDFVTAMRSGELAQVQAGAEFIYHNQPLLAALKAKDWAHAAYYYNGADYAENEYDKQLLENYDKFVNA